MKVCRLLVLFVASIVLRVIGESQFKHDRWVEKGENVDFSCQSQMIQKYQPAIKMSWSKGKTVIDHTSPRIRIDEGGNLHLSEVEPEDAGTYSCLVTYWETTVTASEIKLHVGGKKGTAASEGVSGMPFPWILSGGASGLLILGFIIFTMVRKLRKGSSGKTQGYTQIGTENEDFEAGVEEEDDAEDIYEEVTEEV